MVDVKQNTVHPTSSDIAALHGHDPKKVVFFAFDKNDPGDGQNPVFEQSAISTMGGNPTIYHLNSAKEGVHDSGVIIRTLKEHVKKFGTLKELQIAGHGQTDHISKSASLDVRQFMRDVQEAEKDLGIKIADRIEFTGCRVFADLGKEDVAFYKDMAHSLGTEIVGSHTLTYASSAGTQGRYVQFTPEGKVIQDRLDSPAGYYADRQLHLKEEAVYDYSKDRAWIFRKDEDPNHGPVDQPPVVVAAAKIPVPSFPEITASLNALPLAPHGNAYMDLFKPITVPELPSVTTQPNRTLLRSGANLATTVTDSVAFGTEKKHNIVKDNDGVKTERWIDGVGEKITVVEKETRDADGKKHKIRDASIVSASGEVYTRHDENNKEQWALIKNNRGEAVTDMERTSDGRKLAEQVKPDSAAAGAQVADATSAKSKLAPKMNI